MASAVSRRSLPSKMPLNVKALQGTNLSTSTLSSQILRELVIPALEKEVNEGANFAQLRQVFYSLILATWYKKKIKDSILAKVYANKNKIEGVKPLVSLRGKSEATDEAISIRTSNFKKIASLPLVARNDTEYIYQQYLQSFKKGVYNYIKEEPDSRINQDIPRKYFSGGVIGAYVDSAMRVENDPKVAMQNLVGGKGLMRVDGNFNFINPSDRAMTNLVSPFPDLGDPKPNLWQLGVALRHKYELRNILKGGPIKIPPMIFALKREDELLSAKGKAIIDTSYIPAFSDPRDVRSFKDISEDIAEGKMIESMVYKPNFSNSGQGIFFIEPEASGRILITIDATNLRTGVIRNRLANLNLDGVSFTETASNNLLQITLSENMQPQDKHKVLQSLYRTNSTDGQIYDSGVMESKIKTLLYQGRIYESRHFGVVSGKTRKANLQKEKSFSYLGGSSYFANYSARNNSERLSRKDFYTPLYELYPYLRTQRYIGTLHPELHGKTFEEFVDILIEKEFNYLMDRLIAGGFDLSGSSIQGNLDLLWRAPSTIGGFPEPCLVEAHLLLTKDMNQQLPAAGKADEAMASEYDKAQSTYEVNRAADSDRAMNVSEERGLIAMRSIKHDFWNNLLGYARSFGLGVRRILEDSHQEVPDDLNLLNTLSNEIQLSIGEQKLEIFLQKLKELRKVLIKYAPLYNHIPESMYIGFIEMQESTRVEAEEYYREIATMPLAIVDDLISFIEGNLNERIEVLRVDDNFIKEALNGMDPPNIKVNLQVGENIEFKADRRKAVNILRTLMTNSVQLAQERNIEAAKAEVDVKSDNEQVVIEYVDNAGGFRDASLKLLDYLDPDQPDRQGAFLMGTTQRIGGTGLGLAEVYHIVQLHGGFIRVENVFNGQGLPIGAKFTIRLSLSDATMTAVSHEKMEVIKILAGIFSEYQGYDFNFAKDVHLANQNINGQFVLDTLKDPIWIVPNKEGDQFVIEHDVDLSRLRSYIKPRSTYNLIEIFVRQQRLYCLLWSVEDSTYIIFDAPKDLGRGSLITEEPKDLDSGMNSHREIDEGMISAPGGIDLNPAQMSIETKKQGEDFHFNFNGQEIDAAQVVGVEFEIQQMLPVTNLPLLLGLSKGSAQQLVLQK